MQIPPQLMSAAWQVTWHAEATQVDPAGHVVPAVPTPHGPVAPQYLSLVVGSMQAPPQLTSVARHDVVHEPVEHTCPDGQAIPAVPLSAVAHCPVAPQKALLDAGSTQLPPQLISVPGHETWQVPVLQTWPARQGIPALPPASPVPQPDVAPQNVRSVWGFTHVPPQLTSPA
jgi:hypothetical protein